MRHSQQDRQALIVGMFLDFRGKRFDCVRKLAGLEQGEAKIHLQTRQSSDSEQLPAGKNRLRYPSAPAVLQANQGARAPRRC